MTLCSFSGYPNLVSGRPAVSLFLRRSNIVSNDGHGVVSGVLHRSCYHILCVVMILPLCFVTDSFWLAISACIFIISFVWLVLLSVEIFMRWSVSDTILREHPTRTPTCFHLSIEMRIQDHWWRCSYLQMESRSWCSLCCECYLTS